MAGEQVRKEQGASHEVVFQGRMSEIRAALNLTGAANGAVSAVSQSLRCSCGFELTQDLGVAKMLPATIQSQLPGWVGSSALAHAKDLAFPGLGWR